MRRALHSWVWRHVAPGVLCLRPQSCGLFIKSTVVLRTNGRSGPDRRLSQGFQGLQLIWGEGGGSIRPPPPPPPPPLELWLTFLWMVNLMQKQHNNTMLENAPGSTKAKS